MICKRCGAEVNPRTGICDNCGARYMPPQRQRRPQQVERRSAPYGNGRPPMQRPHDPRYDYQYNSAYYPEEQTVPVKKKKSMLSLVALILGVLAIIIEFTAASGSMNSASSDAEQVGAAIGLAIVLPSVIMLIIAVILNLIGFLVNNKVLTLISAIFYTLAFFLFFLWGFVAIPSMVLQFVAYAKMKKA